MPLPQHSSRRATGSTFRYGLAVDAPLVMLQLGPINLEKTHNNTIESLLTTVITQAQQCHLPNRNSHVCLQTELDEQDISFGGDDNM